MLSEPGTYKKAIFATIMAILTPLSILLVGETTPADLTWGQWVSLAAGAVVAFFGTYNLTNNPTTTPTV